MKLTLYGIVFEKNMKKIIIVLLVFLFIWKCGCSNDESLDKTNYPSAVRIDKWYEGGSLHKAKIIDWKVASEENKLASCGDFVYAVNKDLSIDEVKQKAKDLRICINEAVKGHDVVDDSSVAEIAAICITLLEN